MTSIKESVSIPLVIIKEGLVRAYVPNPEYYKRADGVYEPSWAPVFYNPRMEFNRDIAILFVNTIDYPHRMVVTDPLAGTGIRGIRYAIECPNIEKVYINDINPVAYELMEKNVELNKVENKVNIDNLEANLMLRYYSMMSVKFDLIDIDPFGSPIPFIDSALNALRNRGFLAVTATDTAPLTGTHPEACLRRYQARIIRTDFEKEIALRVLLASLAIRGAVFDYHMEVYLSYYADHYVRAYVRYEKSAKRATEMLKSKIGYIVYCTNCLFRDTTLEPQENKNLCPICSSKTILLGPVWLGNLGRSGIVKKALLTLERLQLNTKNRIESLFKILEKEYTVTTPYYRLDKLCSRLRTSMPPIRDIINKIESLGYKALRTHFDNRGLRTNMPFYMLRNVILSF